MSRDKRRKKRKKKKKEFIPLANTPPINYNRVASQFGVMKSRGLTIQTSTYGPLVEANNPKELEERATQALVDQTEDETN